MIPHVREPFDNQSPIGRVVRGLSHHRCRCCRLRRALSFRLAIELRIGLFKSFSRKVVLTSLELVQSFSCLHWIHPLSAQALSVLTIASRRSARALAFVKCSKSSSRMIAHQKCQTKLLGSSFQIGKVSSVECSQ